MKKEIDTLAMTKRLQAGGLTEKQADAITYELCYLAGGRSREWALEYWREEGLPLPSNEENGSETRN